MDRIILTGIEVYAWGGVSDAEREVGQRYRISVEIEHDLRAAAERDDIEATVHYGHVANTVRESLRSRPFRLLESAAERVANDILHGFPGEAVTVRLEKLLPPIDGVVASAAVQIRRERQE